jgi:protease I
MARLDGTTVGILVANAGVEQVEMTEPRQALDDAGATTLLISLESGDVRGYQHDLEPKDTFTPDKTVEDVDAAELDALLLPGGTVNADKVRLNETAVGLIRAVTDAGKPVAAICHGPWGLVEADVVRGKTLTSYPSLRTDIRNAGGSWVDEEVHIDGRNGFLLVTSRKPDDLPAFCTAMVAEFA